MEVQENQIWLCRLCSLTLVLVFGCARAEPKVAKLGTAGQSGEALALARASLKQMEQIHDYSAHFVRRELTGGQLTEPEHMFMKVRHEPFSVYARVLKPESIAGREVIYVAGKNDGNMLVHEVGLFANLGTLPLKPDGFLARQAGSHPITDVGMKNLVEMLLERADKDQRLGVEGMVVIEETELDGRPARCIKVTHPTADERVDFYKARFYIDEQLNIPVRFEAYDWPQPGGEPELIEQYIYTEIELNQNFTDIDFDPSNPDYEFQ